MFNGENRAQVCDMLRVSKTIPNNEVQRLSYNNTKVIGSTMLHHGEEKIPNFHLSIDTSPLVTIYLIAKTPHNIKKVQLNVNLM